MDTITAAAARVAYRGPSGGALGLAAANLRRLGWILRQLDGSKALILQLCDNQCPPIIVRAFRDELTECLAVRTGRRQFLDGDTLVPRREAGLFFIFRVSKGRVSLMRLPTSLRRWRAFIISTINIIGLLLSMAGVVLLFWYALPNEPPGGPINLAGGGGDPEWEARVQLYDWYAHLGLVFVLLGTVLEAVPPACTAIGCWQRRPVSAPKA